MPLKPETVVSAVAVLRPAKGRPGRAPSAATLEKWAPPPGASERAVGALRALGFDASQAGLGSIIFSAKAKTFESVFGVSLENTPRGGVVCSGGSPDLPVGNAPPQLADLFLSAGFEQPPDFGPESFG